MVSKEMENLINLLRTQISTMEISVENIRNGLEQLAIMTKLPKDVKCEPIDVMGVPAEWITTPESIKEKVVLYLHGGGWIAGSINTHRDLASRISRASKTRILIIDYRLAPEHPYPAGLEDSITAYKWLINVEKIVPNNVVIAGDSAGGGLTIGCLIALRDEGVPLPAAAVCLSPGVDATMSGESLKSKVEVDPFLTPESVEFMVKQLLGDTDPEEVNLLNKNLQGLPPLLIQVGTSEILLDDSIRLAELAKAAGVNVKLEVWDDMIHVFQAFAAFAPESREAIGKIGEFIQNYLIK